MWFLYCIWPLRVRLFLGVVYRIAKERLPWDQCFRMSDVLQSLAPITQTLWSPRGSIFLDWLQILNFQEWCCQTVHLLYKVRVYQQGDYGENTVATQRNDLFQQLWSQHPSGTAWAPTKQHSPMCHFMGFGPKSHSGPGWGSGLLKT